MSLCRFLDVRIHATEYFPNAEDTAISDYIKSVLDA